LLSHRNWYMVALVLAFFLCLTTDQVSLLRLSRPLPC
jgi:hypothetical protein